MFSNVGANFRQLPYLMPFYGRQLISHTLVAENYGSADRLPPDIPQSYPPYRRAGVPDGFPGDQADRLEIAHFFRSWFSSEFAAGLATEAAKNCWNCDSAWPPTH